MDKTKHKLKVVSPPAKKRRKKKKSSTSSSTESTKPAVTSSSKGRPKATSSSTSQPKKKAKRKPSPESSPSKPVKPQKVTTQAVPTENQYYLVICLLGELPRCEVYSNEDQVRSAIREVTEGRALLDVRLFLFHGKQLGFKPKVLDKPNIIVQRVDGGDMTITNNPNGSMLNNTGEIVTLPDSISPAAVKATGKEDKAEEDDLGFSW